MFISDIFEKTSFSQMDEMEKWNLFLRCLKQFLFSSSYAHYFRSSGNVDECLHRKPSTPSFKSLALDSFSRKKSFGFAAHIFDYLERENFLHFKEYSLTFENFILVTAWYAHRLFSVSLTKSVSIFFRSKCHAISVQVRHTITSEMEEIASRWIITFLYHRIYFCHFYSHHFIYDGQALDGLCFI